MAIHQADFSPGYRLVLPRCRRCIKAKHFRVAHSLLSTGPRQAVCILVYVIRTEMERSVVAPAVPFSRLCLALRDRLVLDNRRRSDDLLFVLGLGFGDDLLLVLKNS